METKEELGLANKWLVRAFIRLDDAADLPAAEGTLLDLSSQQLDEYTLFPSCACSK